MSAIHAEFPELVIQHEDFATERAFDVCDSGRVYFEDS